MNKLEAVETLVSKIPCPVCLNSRFEVNLSCEMANTPCDYHATCGKCGYRMVISPETKTMDKIWTDVQRHVKEKGCPECGDKDLNLEFLCDMKSEDCFFLVSCAQNGHYSRLTRDSIHYLFS